MSEKIIKFIGEDGITPVVENIGNKAESVNNNLLNQNRQLVESNEKVADSYKKVSDSQNGGTIRDFINNKQREVEFSGEEVRPKSKKFAGVERETPSGIKYIDISEERKEVSGLPPKERETELETKEVSIKPLYDFDNFVNPNKYTQFTGENSRYAETKKEEEENKRIKEVVEKNKQEQLFKQAEAKRISEEKAEEERRAEEKRLEDKKLAEQEALRQKEEADIARNKHIREIPSEKLNEIYTKVKGEEKDPRKLVETLNKEVSFSEKLDKNDIQRRLYEAEKISDPTKRKEAISALSQEAKELNLIYAGIRELIDIQKRDSDQQVRADRRNTEEVINENKKNIYNKGLGGYNDIEQAKRETFLAASLAETKVGEKKEASPSEVDKLVRKLIGAEAISRSISTAGNIIGSNNKYESTVEATATVTSVIGTVLSVIPYIGSALGSLFKGLSEVETKLGYKALGSAGNLENAGSGVATIAGGKWSDYTGMGADMTKYGYDQAKFLQEAALTARNVGDNDLENKTKQAIYLSKIGVDRSNVNTIEKLQRFDNSKNDSSTDYVNQLYKDLRASKTIGAGDTYMIPEYLNIANQLNKEQLDRLGRVDTGINNRMIASIAGLNESFKNPEVLRQVVSNVNSGLQNSATPQVEALQFETLAQLHPEMGFYELQKEKEKGMASGGYFASFVDKLKTTGFDFPDQVRMSQATFGGSLQINEDLMSGRIKTEKEFEKAKNRVEGINFEKRSEDATNRIERSSAERANLFEQAGEKMVDAMDKITDGLSGVLKKVLELLSKTETKPTNAEIKFQDKSRKNAEANQGAATGGMYPGVTVQWEPDDLSQPEIQDLNFQSDSARRRENKLHIKNNPH